jgi:hypothetical protein
MTEEISFTWPRKRPYKNVLQFKITLLETDPQVWRRIQVPEYYTFYDLHVAIQDAMDWLDYHLHAFEIRIGRQMHQAVRIECPFAVDEIEEENPLFSTEVPLSDFLKKPEDHALYIYDFGDGWELDVVFEKALAKELGKKYPLCLGGEMAGPPEDCGGIPGYYNCIKAVKERDNSEDLLTWLGRWKPDRFDPARVKFWSPLERLKKAFED